MEFVRLWRTNYARSRLQKLAEKPEGAFRQAQAPRGPKTAGGLLYFRPSGPGKTLAPPLGELSAQPTERALSGSPFGLPPVHYGMIGTGNHHYEIRRATHRFQRESEGPCGRKIQKEFTTMALDIFSTL